MQCLFKKLFLIEKAKTSAITPMHDGHGALRGSAAVLLKFYLFYSTK